MSTITEEEENYARISLLLSGISQRATRAYFDSEFHPSCLYKSLKKESVKLKQLKKKRKINFTQWTLLFPQRGNPESKNFDVTLMIILLRHLAAIDIPDKDFNCLPLETDPTPSTDLATIKFYRNCIAHKANGKVESSYFIEAWDHITTVVERLGGKNMLDECKELKTKTFKQSTVPWNIRVQFNQILETWKMNNSTFVETKAATHVYNCVQRHSCVTITASSGVGKTATLQNVVLKMVGEGYDVIPIINAHDIVQFYNPNKKTLFVMDDYVGINSINQGDFTSLESVMNRLKVLIENKLTKIIVACRLQVYQDDKFASIFRECVCNLQSEDLRLSKTEKQSIAELYLETKYSEIMQYCNLYECFPLLCKLYNDNPELNIIDFFKSPFPVYEAEIDKLKTGDNEKYCALALCVMFNNRLKEEWLTEKINKKLKAIIKNTCEACRLNRGTSRFVLLDELKKLEHTFIKKDQGVYKAIHETIFEFLSFYIGKNMIQCFIENADSRVIRQRFLLESKDGMNQFITVVPPKYHQMYMQRMIDDWFKGTIQYVFSNINMNISEFRERFLCFLKTFDNSFQIKLALICDVDGGDTALLQCCQYDDIPFIKWCIEHGDDVNKCRFDGVCPLNVAALEGQIKVVKLLIEKKADTNKCDDKGTSAVLIACQNNHIDVVKLLLDNKADIDKCRSDGASPFFISCHNNHIKIVKVLLDKKADINKCANNGVSPLYIACFFNHIEVVKVLLDNKADINKCDDNESSPLYIACQNNHKETVKVLLDNKADINKCARNGTSPLNIACQGNHKEIVKVLLDYKADINKCTNDGASPLYIACYNNHIEAVKILLDHEADINMCTNNETSPLHIACQYNHKEIVKVLLDNKADINKCRDDGASPLYIACYNNYIETVKVLLDKKADINKCEYNGVSPLYIACQNNHIETVKVLLDYKADINKCADNGSSPLYVACKINHIGVVKELLNNKADINKCYSNEAPPLYIACQNNKIELVRILLDHKADTDKCDSTGIPPLIVACQRNYIEIVKLLLENKADINKCHGNGASALLIACQNNHKELVKLLLNMKADMNKCENSGASPLTMACFCNHIEIVTLLLDNKADINKGDKYLTPLCIACQKNHIELVKVLLDKKADVDKCASNGVSPLFIACKENHKDIVKILLDNGADINHCTHFGASPCFVAFMRNHVEVVKMLEEKGADCKRVISLCRILAWIINS